MANPLITRQRVVAIKNETTAGTAETLGATEGVMNCYDSEFTPELPVFDREGQGTDDAPLKSVQTTRAGRIKFKTDLIGNSVSAPYWMTHVLQACGFSLSSLVASANGSANAQAATVGIYQNGLYKSVAGAMGKLTIPFKVGEPLMAEAEFLGKLVTPSDQTIIAPTYSTVIPPRVASATATIGSYTPRFSSGTITIENELKLREDATDATGFLACVITKQRITVDLDPEADLVANQDAYGLLMAGTTAAFTLAVGDTGNKLTLAIPAAQHIEVTDGDRDGIMTHPIKLLATRSGSTPMTITAA